MTVNLYSNFAKSILAGSISNSATVLSVASGAGALFPNPGAGQAFYLTLNDAATGLIYEIVQVTGVSGDNMTVVRGQQGTVAIAWNAGDLVYQGITKDDLAGFQQNASSFGRLLGTPLLITSSIVIGSTDLPTGTSFVIAEIVGGGGQGGNAPSTVGAQQSVGSGGTSGSYVAACILSGLVGMSISIGLGGHTGSPTGGDTTVTPVSSSAIIAKGGPQGANSGASSANALAFGSYASGSTPIGSLGVFKSVNGILGTLGIGLDVAGYGAGGTGGDLDQWGSGGGGGGPGAGGNGAGFGAGGGGSYNFGTASLLQGGSGTQGAVLLWCYSA